MVKLQLTVLLACFTFFLHAQTLDIQVSSDTISTDSILHLVYKIDDSCNCKGIDLSEFNVIVGPNVSRSMQFINGQVSQETKCEYYLQAKEAGTFYLPNELCGIISDKAPIVIALDGYISNAQRKELILKKRKIKKI